MTTKNLEIVFTHPVLQNRKRIYLGTYLIVALFEMELNYITDYTEKTSYL